MTDTKAGRAGKKSGLKRIKRLKRKIRHKLKFKGIGQFTKKSKRIACVSFLVVLVFVAAMIYLDQQKMSKYRFSGGKDGDSVQTIRYKGKDYVYNNRIFAFLLIGTDGKGRIRADESYGDKDRADNIMLIILDGTDESVKVLPVSRDTMCFITKYSRNGIDQGSVVDHLGYAFSYGDGARVSCRNTCEAVSNLLYGVDVRTYVAANLSSLPYITELLGEVTVEVPNSDVAFRYPELKKGNTAVIGKKNIESFLRYRDTGKDYSNNGRMERQQAFAEGAVEMVRDFSEDDVLEIWDDYRDNKGRGEKYEGRFLTNISRGRFLRFGSGLSDYEYDPEKGNLKIKGKNRVEDGHDVFYPDESELKDLVVKTFYIEQ